MKGLQGIVIAVALGLVAAFCNWYYIYRQASGYHTESFVIITPTTQLNPGDKFKVEHFKKVDVPIQHVGDLIASGILWKDRETIQGMVANRAYQGGEILLRQDLKTVARKDLSEMLAAGEIAFPVPVDPRTFVPDNFNPGDNISFFVPQYMSSAPQPVPADAENGNNASPAKNEAIIGPFRILALGGRKGSRDVAEAAGSRNTREDVVTVALILKDGNFDEKSTALVRMLNVTANKGVSVVKHPVAKK